MGHLYPKPVSILRQMRTLSTHLMLASGQWMSDWSLILYLGRYPLTWKSYRKGVVVMKALNSRPVSSSYAHRVSHMLRLEGPRKLGCQA